MTGSWVREPRIWPRFVPTNRLKDVHTQLQQRGLACCIKLMAGFAVVSLYADGSAKSKSAAAPKLYFEK